MICASESLVASWCYSGVPLGDRVASGEEEKKQEKHVKLEEVAEETGELFGKSLRKAWSVSKSFGEGLLETLEEREGLKETVFSVCPHCAASIPSDSNFCASCGKKL